MARRTFASLPGAALLLVVATSAHAQSKDDKASALLLYDEAVRLTSLGKVPEACVKYAESERLDPQLGTLLHLADCYEKNGQTASAWASFREAIELAAHRGDPREKVARRRATALETRVPKLVIEVPKPVQDLAVRVERDGKPVHAAMWGVATPVDPGQHVVSASAAGRASWSETVSLTPASLVRVTVPPLAAEPARAAGLSGGSKGANLAPIPMSSTSAGADSASSSGSGQKVIGFAMMGVGAAGAAVGTVFGLRTLRDNGAAKKLCPGANNECADPADIPTHKELTDNARSARLVSIVGFAAGGAALIGGLALVLTAGGSEQRVTLTPRFHHAGGGFELGGTW